VLQWHQNEREVGSFRVADVALGDRHARSAIGQEVAQFVTRNNQNADVDLTGLDCIPQVHDIHHDKVASRGISMATTGRSRPGSRIA
jgi:hypothetical protein